MFASLPLGTGETLNTFNLIWKLLSSQSIYSQLISISFTGYLYYVLSIVLHITAGTTTIATQWVPCSQIWTSHFTTTECFCVQLFIIDPRILQ